MRRIPVLTLLLAVLTVLAPRASAADGLHILQGCLTPEDQIQVFVSGAPDGGSFHASLGGTEVPVIRAASAAAQPMTYYCLTDVSRAMTEGQLTREKEVLRALCSRLATGDRMVIGRMGGRVIPTAYLWDKSAIGAEIDALEIRDEDADLYGGIADALQELTVSDNATIRKCLVLLSDGGDDQVGRYGREEIGQTVREARIPVHAVAVPRTASEDGGGILGALALGSAGGTYQSLDGSGADGCGAAIVEALRGDLIVALDLSGLDRSLLSRGSLPLRLRAVTEDLEREDTIEIDPSRLTLSPRPGIADDPTFWIRMAVAGVLLLAALILLLTGRKKRDPVSETVPPSAPRPAPPSGTAGGSTAGGTADRPPVGDRGGPPVGAAPYRAPRPAPPSPGREAGRTVTFTAIGYEGIRYQIRIPEGRSVTLGRDRRADRILNAEDPRLSGVHFQAGMAGDALRIRDAGSTNGTAVDGVPLPPGESALVREGQTLRAGSYEYRIHLEG